MSKIIKVKFTSSWYHTEYFSGDDNITGKFMEVRFRFHNEWFPVHWECFSIDAQDMGSRYMSSTEDAVLEIPSPLGVIEKRLSEFLTEKRTTVFEARIPDYFDENTN